MTLWLYDSVGSPIAFIANEIYVFHISGNCIGKIVEGEVWNQQYVGEIMEDRLYHNPRHAHRVLDMNLPASRPGVPALPGAKGRARIPAGYRDVYLDEI